MVSAIVSNDLDLKYSAHSNTLNLLPKNWRSGRGLFDLPREIREAIYRLVLVRPALWDKRHQPDCVFHTRWAEAAAEHPPFVQHESHYIVTTKTWYASCAERRRCETLCGHRGVHTTALLRVSRRLYADAAPLYWAHKWLCFSSYDSFLTTLSSLSDEQCRRIRRLSLQSLEGRPNDSGPEWRQARRAEVLAALDRCTNLQSVELPQPVLSAWLADDRRLIATMLALRTVTALHTWVHHLSAPVPDAHEEMVYLLGARQARRAVACPAHDGSRSGISDVEGDASSVTKSSRKSCAACRARIQASRAAAKALVSFSWNRYYPKEALQEAVAAQLEERQPSHSDDGEGEGDGTSAHPYTFPIVHETHDYEVTIWGLPRLSLAARTELVAKKKLEERLAAVKPRTHPTIQVVTVPRDEEEDEGQFVATMQKKKERRPRQGKTEAAVEKNGGGASSRDDVLRERRERRELREKEEREEKAQKKAGTRAERRESEVALREQRKALRTRKGKLKAV